jgi:hypothetical protein
MIAEEVLLGYVLVLDFPRCHDLVGNRNVEFDHDIL